MLALLAGASRAEPVAPTPGPTAASAPPVVAGCPDDAAARLAFIRGSLRRTARWSRVWYGSWIAGYATLAGGSAGLIGVVSTDDERIGWGISAAASLVGVIFAAASWPVAISESNRLEARAARSTDVCATLVEAERALGRAADAQRAARRWYWHVLNVAFNLASGLTVGLVAHDWVNAAITFGVGTGLGEATILTLPRGSMIDLERYRRGQLGAAPAPAPVSLLPLGGRDVVGLAVGGSF